jgi:spermidine synthase
MLEKERNTCIWFRENLTPWDIYTHGITRILVNQQTAYQDMYIVESNSYGKGLILDGRWQSSTADEFLYHEALVQPAMTYQGNPKNVLILGGGEGATVREVARWKTVEKIVMVDIDGEVVQACQKHLQEMHQNAFDDPRLELIIGDALKFLDTTSQDWDVIISDLSEPVESGPSFQLFTKEFFAKIQRGLKPNGFFVLQAGSLSPIELNLHSRLANTLKTVFPNVHSYSSYIPTFATPWGFLIASGEPIPVRVEPEKVDELLAEKTTGNLRMFDGTTLLGMMQSPAHIRKAIENETEVYTLEKPPQLSGEGWLGRQED